MSKKYKDGRDDTPNAPNAGLTLHPEKAAHDQKQGRAGLNKPEAGGHVREQKRDDTVPNPQGGDAPIPKEHLHLDKAAYEKARKHEPKGAKGAKYADGSSSTKCD